MESSSGFSGILSDAPFVTVLLDTGSRRGERRNALPHSPGAITGAAEKEARQVPAVPATSRGAKWTAAEWQNRPAEPRGLVPTEYRCPPILTVRAVGVGGPALRSEPSRVSLEKE